MNIPTRKWHPFGRTKEEEEDEDLNILKEGGETGWWDNKGRPAPWPQDFLDPEAGWTNGNNTSHDHNHAKNDPENPPF